MLAGCLLASGVHALCELLLETLRLLLEASTLEQSRLQAVRRARPLILHRRDLGAEQRPHDVVCAQHGRWPAALVRHRLGVIAHLLKARQRFGRHDHVPGRLRRRLRTRAAGLARDRFLRRLGTRLGLQPIDDVARRFELLEDLFEP